MSTICQIIDSLQNLTNAKITQSDIARVFGVTRATINSRVKNQSKVTFNEIKKLEEFYNVSLTNQTLSERLASGSIYQPAYAAKIVEDEVKIPYWEGLPDELKHVGYDYVLAQKTSIEQGWGLAPENLCITVMNGDAMENYWYKIRNNDVLIVDTSERKVNANGCGVYFATSRNNSMFWIREMQMLYNGDIEFHSYSPSGVKTKVLTQKELDDNDFKIIGKVIKNVSFRL